MKQLLYLALAGVLLAGCRPPDLVTCGPVPTATMPTPPAVPSSSISLTDFLAKYQPALRRYNFLIGQGPAVQAAGGATVALSQVSFAYASGAAARDSAALYLREVYTVPDMVLADLPTVSAAGELLITGGEFYLQVRKQGQPLRVAPASAVLPRLQAPIPAGQDTTRRTLWQRGSPVAGWSSLGGGQVQVAGGSYVASVPLDTVPYLGINQTWRFYGQGAVPVSVAVEVAAPAGSAVRVLLRPVGFNGLYRAATAAGAPAGNALYTASLPAGTSLNVLVLQSIGGQLYAGLQAATAQSGLRLVPTLAPVSEADALAYIRAL